MRSRIALALAAAAALTVPAAAQADHRHLVTAGESLTGIAAADHVSVGALAAANGLSPTARLIAGSTLRIPATAGRRAAPPRRTAAASHHYVIRAGDTLSGLAAHAGVSVAALAGLNHIRASARLVAGASLLLPGPGSTTASTHATATQQRTAASHRYVIRAGDTLSGLAGHEGVSVDALAALNHIHPSARLIAGASLLLPGPGSTTASTHATATHQRTAAGDRYVIRAGDTLSALAAHAGVSVAALAALNHIRPNALLIAGSALVLPGGSGSRSAAGPASQRYVVERGDTLSAIAARAGVSVDALAALNHIRPNGLLIAGASILVPGTASVSVGSSIPPERYVVAPGDTLSGIAANAGVSLDALTTLNHLSPSGLLIAGATILVPGAGGPPYPTPERVTASEVEQLADANGVPGSLAAAIGWQESGFNNDLVSNADARGVMQILPRTWTWIERTLDSGTPLAPASAIDNVRGGVLLLRSLLDATDGDESLAIAGYIQGLPSVRRYGMFAVTRQYVRDVLALRSMFGGP